MRKYALLAAFAAIVVAVPFAAARPAAAAAPPSASFNPNLFLQSSNSAGEPSIRTDQFGRPLVIAPIGVPAGCKAFRVRHDGSGSTFLGFPDHGAGGGDCDWALGPQETAVPSSDSVLAYSSLTLANITVGKSDDGGTTFGPPNAAATQLAVDDRMWMAADPALNAAGLDDIFMTYHDLDTFDIQLSVSVDGGQTYVQSGPIINNTDVPPGQWAGSCTLASCLVVPFGVGNGNELGNIVAYRPKGGSLKLYSIFTTPDSTDDNLNGPGGQNRLYEAIGTVTDAGAGVPAISWRNYEIWHGPLGAHYDKIFPITAVDATGHAYAIWTDGFQIFEKTSSDGTSWGCPVPSTSPGGLAPCTSPSAIPLPSGIHTTVMPWADAGKDGIVDVVFYGGTGSAPNDTSSNNQWNVYMAQTVDGGSSWTVNKASDHVIHTGEICLSGTGCSSARTLLDFFQVSIDPTNGAADIAYTDDHASPGKAVLYFTRQCTGVSATTGVALTNDCVPPPPPPTPPAQTTCPGPQVADFTNDAPNNYPGGQGQNMDNLDIENAFFGSSAGSAHIDVTLTIKNLQAPPTADNANYTGGLWIVYWQQAGTANAPGGHTWWFARATTTGSGSTAAASFSDGTFDAAADAYSNTHGDTGAFNPGPNGTFVIHVPRANVGSPADGATLTNTYADTSPTLTALGTGLRYRARADRAPDSNYGADYVVSQTCATPPPPGNPASLTLSPQNETDTVFTSASETATVKDVNGNPVPNKVVRFTVTGANPGTYTQTTDQFGQATISYTGQNTGTDTISAFADTDNNGSQGSGEPSGTATKKWVVPASTPGCVVKMTDGGSITAANGDQGTFGGNAQITSGGSVSGQEQYQDHGPVQPLNANSSSVTSIVCSSNKTQATLYGRATVNGSGSYTYRVVLQDNGSNGSTDAYGIRLSNGYDSGLQSLHSGNIDIHKN